jgi:uncharacterized membrane protein YeaQ/YmgE (transglycosylase-associated protein family)
MWIVTGAGAALLARLVDAGRPPGWFLEVVLGIVAACAAGLAATALDFGGWREPDWRAALFTFFTAAAAVGLFRLTRILRS